MRRARDIFLAASLATALWAVIILGGAWIVGAALDRTGFWAVLTTIFALLVLGIGLAISAGSSDSNPED